MQETQQLMQVALARGLQRVLPFRLAADFPNNYNKEGESPAKVDSPSHRQKLPTGFEPALHNLKIPPL